MKVFLICLSASLAGVGAFTPSRHVGVRSSQSALQVVSPSSDDAPLQDRRDIFSRAVVTASAASLSSLFPLDASAAERSGIGTDPESPIVVIGAGGKVGGLLNPKKPCSLQ